MGLYYGAGLAIGLAGLGVAIGQGVLADKSIKVMAKNKELGGTVLVLTILGIALVESAAIYGLIVSFQILGLDPSTAIHPGKILGAGLAVGMGGLGAGVGEGFLVAGAIEAILRNPAMKGKIMTYMVLFLALIEAVAIYGLIISMQLLSAE